MAWLKQKEKAIQWLGKYRFLVLAVLLGLGLMLIPSGDQEKASAPAASAAAVEFWASTSKSCTLVGFWMAVPTMPVLTVSTEDVPLASV